MDTVNDYLSQLNEPQRQAVVYTDGPSMVVAGAGSGKTRVLTYKIAHLLQEGLPPYAILALTFTNKAAREMKHRIATLAGEAVAKRLWMSTFHSIFYRILRYEAEHIGYPPDFTVYDSADTKNLLRSILKEMQLDDKTYRPGLVQSRISNAKNALITVEAYERNGELMEYDRRSRVPLLHEIYRRYQARCNQAAAMDFDELLLQTNLLFRDHPEVLERYREKFRYVLVDEYQDTNFAQHLIVTRLCETHRRICVVGDDAQSIYSFRGANIDNMLRFQEQYPECRLFKLEQNYRSTQNIVNAANSLIAKNRGQIPKNVFSKNEPGRPLHVYASYSDYEEGYLIASQIAERRIDDRAPYAAFAVLYRTNAQSRVIEEAMRKRNIPYRLYGSQSFYQRKEVKDIVAYFRVIVNPHDEEALKRIINYPARGIGSTTLSKLADAANRHSVSLWTVITDPAAYGVEINRGTAAKLHDFSTAIHEMIEANQTLSAVDMAAFTVRRSGITAALMADRSVEGISRQENMQEVLKAIAEFTEIRLEEGSDHVAIGDFLVEISLITDQDNDTDSQQADNVTLMTVHAAKGLEFDHVFIAGLEDELFPSSMVQDNPQGIEEERRLFYVAITRARQTCTLSYARSRFRNGQHKACSPSFFLDDIDDRFVVRHDDRDAGDMLTENRYRRAFNRDTTPASVPPLRREGLQRLPDGNDEPTAAKERLDGFRTGDIIRHGRFGQGQIVRLEGEGADAKATIEFEHLGIKKLLLKYAKLTTIH